MKLTRALVVGGLCLVTSIASYAATRSMVPRTPRSSSGRSALSTLADSLTHEGYPPGRQLLVYVLYSADCGFCKRPETVAAFQRLRSGVRASALAHGYASVSVIAVSPDFNRKHSLRYLDRVGERAFDEVSIGGGWLNGYLAHLTRQDSTASAGVPQVILASRQVSGSIEPFRIVTTTDSVIAIVPGQPEILRWDSAGFSMDHALRGGRTAAR